MDATLEARRSLKAGHEMGVSIETERRGRFESYFLMQNM